MINQSVHLSPAEHEVARSIVRGESPASAAARMSIPLSRYKAMLHQIQKKSGARTHHEMVALLIGAERRT